MQQFTQKLATDSFKTIAFKRYYAQVHNQRLTGLVETVQVGTSDSKMIEIIRTYIPVRGSRVTTFSTNAHLNKLRLYQSDAVPHQKGSTEDNN